MTNEEMLITITHHDDQLKHHEDRLIKLEAQNEAIFDLASSCKIIASEQQRLGESVSKLTDDVEDLKQKPAKRWEEVVKYIIITCIGAVLGMMFTHLGLS